MKKAFLFILLVSSTASAADNSANYYAPPAQFNASLNVMDMGFANVFALFRLATASLKFDETTKSISNVRIAIDTTSLVTTNDSTQHDLSSLLDAFQYPEIRINAPDSTTFTDNKATLKAVMTLHNISKPITLEVTLNRSGKSPHGGSMWSSEGDALGLSLQSSFKRADFGLNDSLESPARFGDSLTLHLELQAIKQ
jgi:polyisoprenoid-binding protein YceI